MSNPYPPPPKRLVRSTSNRVIGGVCGGVADYLNMDATLVRILTVLISLFTGVPVILYIIALFIVPEGSTTPTAPPPVTGASTYPGPFSGTQASPPPPAYAPYPGAGAAATPPRPTAEDAVWGSEGPPWEQRQSEATPGQNAAPAPEAAPTPQPAAGPGPEAGSTAEPTAPSEPEAPVVPPQGDEPKATEDQPPKA
jgi:phage shock protein PspC (stress-responsive transcriptional regulator)